MHKTSAWPLSLLYAGLIVWASLYPFGEWRDQGGGLFVYLWQPLPKYWTGFDVGVNILGYAPFGFLLSLTALRTGRAQQAVLGATLGAVLMSLSMETLQGLLPTRVSSNLDFGLNVVGAALGAVAARALERAGALVHWSRFRAQWFEANARYGLVLLVMWPVALLFPAAVPFGVGQVVDRLEGVVAELLDDTPFLGWLPVRDQELRALVPGTEVLCVFLGVLTPCLLAFCIVKTRPQRALCVIGTLAAGVGVTALSGAMSFGPQHAWDWLGLPAQVGLGGAAALAALLAMVPRRINAALALLALGIFLAVVNQVPINPYFSQTLHTWEQGRFIRFNGLAQWLGWLWPFAVLLYLVTLVSRPRDFKT